MSIKIRLKNFFYDFLKCQIDLVIENKIIKNNLVTMKIEEIEKILVVKKILTIEAEIERIWEQNNLIIKTDKEEIVNNLVIKVEILEEIELL